MPKFEVYVTTEWRVEVEAKDGDNAIAIVEAFMEPSSENILSEYATVTELED